MPRLTAKQRKIRELRNIIATRESAAMLRDLLSEDESEEDDLDTYWLTELDRVQERRYIARPSCYRRHKNRWMKLLNDPIHTSDADFLKHFRLKRPEFIRLASLVENDAVFKPKGEKPLRGGAMLHLMVLLKFIGAYGNGNTPSDITKFLGLARGSFYNYLDRAIIAVLRLEDAVITWPDSEERRTIARRIKDKYGFVNCVGITDGTLLPLSAKPRHNGEDYYSRKSSYAVNALITCDDVARVRNVGPSLCQGTHFLVRIEGSRGCFISAL